MLVVVSTLPLWKIWVKVSWEYSFQHMESHKNWLVVYLPLWKIWKSVGRIIPYIVEIKKCSKPPTSIDIRHSPWMLIIPGFPHGFSIYIDIGSQFSVHGAKSTWLDFTKPMANSAWAIQWRHCWRPRPQRMAQKWSPRRDHRWLMMA